MGELTLVVGGQKSGKSSTAAAMAAATGATVVVIAPASPVDDEMAERIARHRGDRPSGWRTVETFDLAAALATVDDRSCVIIDAFDTWLAHAMGEARLWTDADVAAWGEEGTLAAQDVLAEVDALASAARARGGDTIVVAGQPGFGLHPMNANGRRYADVHGLSLQRLGTDSRVFLVIAGRSLQLP